MNACASCMQDWLPELHPSERRQKKMKEVNLLRLTLQSENTMLREPNTFSNPSSSPQTSSALASSGSHPIRAIRIPKHLHTPSKIRLLKFSVDCHFPLLQTPIFACHQRCFKWVKSAPKWRHIIFLNQVPQIHGCVCMCMCVHVYVWVYKYIYLLNCVHNFKRDQLIYIN